MAPLVWEQGPLLGSGGMAEVFLAIVRGEGVPKLFAVKRLRAGLLTDDLVRQLEREAQIGAMLKHPNVVGVEASGTDAQGPWLMMEYVAGRSARAFVRAHLQLGRFVKPAVAATIACDAAKGLAYVHGIHDPDRGLHDLVHRDLSSDNILVDLDGCSKLADFGVARITGAVRLTQAGAFKGKTAYAAPEMLAGAQPTFRTDYFALAATLFELFTGRYAFAGRNEAETLDNIVNKPPPRLRDVPDDVAQWVEAAFEREAKNRPSSLTQLVLALGKMSSGQAEVASTLRELGLDRGLKRAEDLTTQLSKSPLRPKRWWPWAAAPAVVAAGIAAAVVLGPSKPLPPVVEVPAPRETPPRPAPAPEPAPAPAPPAVVEPPRPATAPVRVKTGRVAFDIKPFGTVRLGKKLLGIAPMEPVTVPAGWQTFDIGNDELRVYRQASVNVVEGETVDVVLDLRE